MFSQALLNVTSHRGVCLLMIERSTERRLEKRTRRVGITPLRADAMSDARNGVTYRPGQILFAQGDLAHSVFYVRKGKVKLTVVSGEGKEAVVALQGCDEFLGEACLIGQARRRTTAVAMTECDVTEIDKDEILRMIQQVPTFAQMFISQVLAKNTRIEDDLIDYHFNSTEKRLARALLLLANVGSESRSQRITERISQEMLAEMIGATRSRVSHFMNKFRKRGFIDYTGPYLLVRSSLAQVILRDELSGPRPSIGSRRAFESRLPGPGACEGPGRD